MTSNRATGCSGGSPASTRRLAAVGRAGIEDAPVGAHARGCERAAQDPAVVVVAEHGDQLDVAPSAASAAAVPAAPPGAMRVSVCSTTGTGPSRPMRCAGPLTQPSSTASPTTSTRGAARCARDARVAHLQRVGAGHGHEGSTDGVTMSSRTSQPGGPAQREEHGVGDLVRVVEHRVGPGLYCSVRPSKKAVSMPPGMSRVTPTSPASSAASARVMPTTPNLDAQ